jgi:nucleoside-diphosphate-sugar epimerase
MGKCAVVTGGTGAIGNALVRLLPKDGYRVYVLCRSGSVRRRFLSEAAGVHVIERDILDLAPEEEIVTEQCAMFFHLGWHASYGAERLDPYGQVRNIQASLDAVHLAARLGCRVFVGAGSQSQYGPTDAVLTEDTPMRPDTAYGAAKLCAEQMTRLLCRKLGLRHVWGRVCSVYGPCDGPYTLITYLMRASLRDEDALLTPCGQLWDFLFADDAARAFIAMAEKGVDGRAYCVASGQARPLREYIAAFERLPGYNAARIRIGGKPYAKKQRMRLSADISALTADTGFAPAVSFEEGIARTWRWYCEHPEAADVLCGKTGRIAEY